jgi:PHD/YefM family antitoxin component YafN of YafNO toxin-antitoxin module
MSTRIEPTQIAFDAEITVSELRSEETLDQRLHDHSCLRLRRRKELLGVLVSAERWRAIEEAFRSMSEALERLEDAATLRLIEQRVARATYVPVTDDVWADVENRYQELTRGESVKAEIG